MLLLSANQVARSSRSRCHFALFSCANTLAACPKIISDCTFDVVVFASTG